MDELVSGRTRTTEIFKNMELPVNDYIDITRSTLAGEAPKSLEGIIELIMLY